MKFTENRRKQLLFQIAKKIKYSQHISFSQVAEELRISRQTIYKYIKILENEKILYRTTSGKYKLRTLAIARKRLANKRIDESVIYDRYIRQQVELLNKKCIEKIKYASQEMINNVIEHSEGTSLGIVIAEDFVSVRILVSDNGIGIFKKISDFFHLESLHDAMLELDKGKCTTASANHTGEGIFFSSRIFDFFFIQANGLTYASGTSDRHGYLLEGIKGVRTQGTQVSMELLKDNVQSLSEVFGQYSDDEYGFNKTVVPVVRLIDRRNDTDMSLISRSQARRLLHRFDRFSTVVLDFRCIDSIGQGFADEVFRVYAKAHPEIAISYINANSDIEAMVKHVKNTK